MVKQEDQVDKEDQVGQSEKKIIQKTRKPSKFSAIYFKKTVSFLQL